MIGKGGLVGKEDRSTVILGLGEGLIISDCDLLCLAFSPQDTEVQYLGTYVLQLSYPKTTTPCHTRLEGSPPPLIVNERWIENHP